MQLNSHRNATAMAREPARTGTVLLEGKVACDCGRCRGKAVSCSEFEEHAGSHDRRPAESILLVDACLTLKDLCAMVRRLRVVQADIGVSD